MSEIRQVAESALSNEPIGSPRAQNVGQPHQFSPTRSNSDPSASLRKESILAARSFLRGPSTSSSSSDPTSSSHRSTSSVAPAILPSRLGSLSQPQLGLQTIDYLHNFPWSPYHKVILFPQTLSAIPQQSQSSSRQESDPSSTSQRRATSYLLSSPPRQASVSTAISSTDVPALIDPPPFPLNLDHALTAVPQQTPATSSECIVDGRSRQSPPTSPRQLHPVDLRIVPHRKSSFKSAEPTLSFDPAGPPPAREIKTARFAQDPVSPVSPLSPQNPSSPISPTSRQPSEPLSPRRIPRKPLVSQSNFERHPSVLLQPSLDRPLPPLPKTVAFKSQQELIRDRILERARANAVARYREVSGSQIRRGSRPSYRRFYGSDHQNLRDPAILTSRFIKETSVSGPRISTPVHPALRKTSSVSYHPSLSQRSQRSQPPSSRGGSSSTRGGSSSTRGGSRSTREGSSSTDSSKRGPQYIVYRAPHEPETIWERYVNRRRAILEREALDVNRHSGSTHWTWRDSYHPYSPTMDPIPDGERPGTENSSRTLSEPDNGRSQEARLRDLEDARARNLPPLPGDYHDEKNGVADLERQFVKAGLEGGSDKDPNIVEWNGPGDPENPMNWSFGRKTAATVSMGFMTFVITFASSVFSTATVQVSREYNVSLEVAVLGTALFVLGFAPGPIIWGPLSELYGRKYPMFFGYAVFAIFNIAVATSQNVYSIMICRFMAGLFGCAPFAVIAGALADFYGPVHRAVGACVFAGATFVGPAAGPIIGGFVTESYLGWRWTQYLTAIMAFTSMTIGWIVIPESYAPVLLSRKAKKLKFETQNWALRAKFDESQVDWKVIAQKYIMRPFRMLFLEPILLLTTIYLAFIYGLLYLFFEAYPISFQLQRGWSEGVGGLPFIALSLGIVAGCGIISYMTLGRYARRLKANGGIPVPEERLPPMIIGAALLPIGLFWFAWTSNPSINWGPQVISGAVIGAGILMVFLAGLLYLVDTFLLYANSAIAANTFVRALFGAGFPLFATSMYQNLGVAWATSTLAFIALALFPVPILFFIYGKRLRALSKFSPYT